MVTVSFYTTVKHQTVWGTNSTSQTEAMSVTNQRGLPVKSGSRNWRPWWWLVCALRLYSLREAEDLQGSDVFERVSSADDTVCVVTSSSCSVGPETFVVCRLESHPGWFHGCWPWQRDRWRASFSLRITLLVIDNDRCVFLPSGEVWRNRKRFIKIFSTHQPVRVLCALNLQHKHPNINESHHGLASGWLTVDRVGSGPDSEPVRLDYSKPEGNNLTSEIRFYKPSILFHPHQGRRGGAGYTPDRSPARFKAKLRGHTYDQFRFSN